MTLGSLGNGVNQFNEPEGLTIDSAGRIYVADETNNRIVRFNDMTGAGWTTFGTFGNGAGQFKLPHDVQVDTLGRIYIADTTNQRIVRIHSMAGDGWVEFGRNGCYGCNPDISVSFDERAANDDEIANPCVLFFCMRDQFADLRIVACLQVRQ